MWSVVHIEGRQALGRKAPTAPSSHYHTVGDLPHLGSLIHKCVGYGFPGSALRLGWPVGRWLDSGNTSQGQPAALQPRVPLCLLGRLFHTQRAGVQTRFVPGFGALVKLVSGPVLINTRLG